MRFSILSIILLTFWIALGVQTYLGRQRVVLATEEQKKSEARIADLSAEIAIWQQQELLPRVTAFKRELGHLEKLEQELANALDEEAEALSALKVNGETVSIRSIPKLGRARRAQQTVKVFIPETRRVALKVELRKKDDRTGSDSPDYTPPADGLSGFEGEHPVVLELKPGIRIVEYWYDYRDDAANPHFVALVDGEEVSRLTCLNKASGYSSSQTNWHHQQDISADRKLPKLMELTPSGMETKIVLLFDDVNP